MWRSVLLYEFQDQNTHPSGLPGSLRKARSR